MNFNTREYWENRKNPNNKNVDRKPEADFIKKHIEGAESLLDFGCGIGAMSYTYKKVPNAIGVDFVSNYKSKYQEKSKREHLVHDIYKEKLPFENQHFDVCLLSKVLLHVTPEQLSTVLEECIRVSKRVVITTALTKKPAKHCFNHVYEDYLKEYEAYQVDVEVNTTTGELFLKFDNPLIKEEA